jgi:hypothetical protein
MNCDMRAVGMEGARECGADAFRGARDENCLT